MTWKAARRTRLFVVDPEITDYDSLLSGNGQRDFEAVCFRSGREALRTNPEDSPQMWVINVRLPDMDGTMLHDMLRARGCDVPIALIGNQYSVEDELNARTSGASIYLAKPLSLEFFDATCCG